MTDSGAAPSSPVPPTPAGSDGFYLCDLARTSCEFSVVDASGEVVELPTEAEVRALVNHRYPGARLLLTTRRSVVEGEDLGMFVVLMVLRESAASAGQWAPVACIGGAAHGPRCVPFSPDLWPEAIDGIGISRASPPNVTAPALSAGRDP